MTEEFACPMFPGIHDEVLYSPLHLAISVTGSDTSAKIEKKKGVNGLHRTLLPPSLAQEQIS